MEILQHLPSSSWARRLGFLPLITSQMLSSVLAELPDSWPTAWEMTDVQDSSSEWWKALRIQTVPGVRYHLQESSNLQADQWTTIESSYGSGGEWLCPLFEGEEPVTAPSPTSPIPVPSANTHHRQVMLIIEKNLSGEITISWNSLDDTTPRRMILPGITLDPVWDEFDASYLYPHGAFFYGLSPRLGNPINFSDPAPTLGPIDTGMVAAFTAALPAITSNIQQSITNAAQNAALPYVPGERGFYRVAADWTVDSDGDGRFDWQETIFDGNNPFARDSDGDGNDDVARDNSGPEPQLSTSPGTLIEDPPLASVEHNEIRMSRQANYPNLQNAIPSIHDYWIFPPANTPAGFVGNFHNLRTFDQLAEAIGSQDLDEEAWRPYSPYFQCSHWNSESSGTEFDEFEISRVAFRLSLENPAPPGGYSIPLRIVRFSMDTPTLVEALTDGPYSGIGFEDLVLTVDEGKTKGNPVFAQNYSTPANKLTAYHAPIISLNSHNLEEIANYQHRSFVNGACVLPENAISAWLSGYKSWSNQITLKWRTQRLAGDGSIGPPSHVPPLMTLAERTQASPPDDLHSRSLSYLRIADPGIYRLEAQINFPGGTTIEIPYLRMEHAKGRFNSKQPVREPNPHLEAGKPDYIGVCPNELAYNLREEAVKWLGRTDYNQKDHVTILPTSLLNPSTRGANKCNLFVTHLANRVGATTPFFFRKSKRHWYTNIVNLIPSAPIARDDWHSNPELNIDLDSPGWIFRDNTNRPSPGMSAASHGNPPNSGHVGILDYDGSWISSGRLDINKFIHISDSDTHYKTTRFRER